ncbi:resistance to inhibitors of cholinesterase protein 3 isoform X8 [Cydia splendana]|uniref:resistance to inhibitors of cholinesterase protein 3 isoform X8 n=1 Tax=Cydia splendana TaxID=1100963 RepID=UPI00300D0E16
MANEEALGPRKTMFVLVIVVGCFAVLWPRILSPLMLGQGQLKPNQLDRDAGVKQERSPIRGAGPHPALRERGRAIPPGAPTPPSRGPVPMPPHARVRSPLNVYFDVDIKPPPIPGMRPPLGSPGGPVPAPKSSMGFVMPIYTICIIVFFVYTLSKILFKRTGSIPYEHVAPDPQFRRRVFRDDSRTSPDSKLGPKERDARDVELEALRARLEETERAMQRIVGQLAKRDAESQENHTRPYTNGSVHNSPIIIASEYVENKEKTPEPEKVEPKEPSPEKEASPEQVELSPEKEASPEPSLEKEASREPAEPTLEKEATPEPEPKEPTPKPSPEELTPEPQESEEESLEKEPERGHLEEDLLKLSEDIKEKKDNLAKSTKDFLHEARENAEKTVELLKEALKEDSPVHVEEEEEEEEVDPDKEVSVKVMGMELTAHTMGRTAAPAPVPASASASASAAARSHEADEVKSIFLETNIPQQSRVLVADFEDRAKPHKKHEPAVVSGKMTLSLIQDAPQDEDLPEIDPESTMDDFTTASAMTQPVAEKEGESSDEEIEEEIEIEEIEEEDDDDEANEGLKEQK